MSRRARAIPIATLLAVAVVVFSTSVAQGIERRWPGPTVVSGWKTGPVQITSPNSYQQVAALNLPAGTWVAWAKLFIDTDPSSAFVRCALDSTGGPNHVGNVQIVEDGPWPDQQSIVLSTSARFRAGGKLVVACRGEAAAARWIKIMAMRVGSLTTVDMASGDKTTRGSSQPKIVLGSKSASVLIPEGTTETVATLPLGSGGWSIRTSFSVAETGDSSGKCWLSIGGIVYDSARVIGDLLHTMVELETATFSGRGRTVKVTCETLVGASVNAAESLEASNIRITAVKLGTLVTFDKDGNVLAQGSSLPKAYFKKAPKHVLTNAQPADVVSLDLEPGRWMMFSRAQLGSAQPSPWGPLQCQLIAAPDYDQSPYERYETPGLPLAVVHRFVEGGRTRLRCTANLAEPFNPTAIDSIRLTAFKLASLTNVAL